MNRPVPRGLRILLLGWGLFLLMWALVAVVRPDDARAAIVFMVLGLLLGSWVALRGSRAALVTSLVVGVLHAVEQVAYTVAELGADPVETSIVVLDGVGLLSGLLIVGGATASLRERRRSRPVRPSGSPGGPTQRREDPARPLDRQI